MEINGNYRTEQYTKSINEGAAERGEKPAAIISGDKLKGRIIEMARNETPPGVTVRLSSGELVQGSIEPPLPSDIKAGDYVKFDGVEQDGRLIFQNMEQVSTKSSEEAKLAMMKSALEMAGLKSDKSNLQLVSLLLEHEMPINKESIIALSRAVRLSGVENAEKAILLMKNDISPSPGAIEKLSQYVFEGGKFTEGLEALARNIMEMDNEPEKLKLLRVFFEGEQGGGSAGGFAGDTPPQSSQEIIKGNEIKNPQAANLQAGQMLEITGKSEQLITVPDAETGTKFFRELFSVDRETLLAQNKPHPETERFIDANLEKLKRGFTELLRKGDITEERVEGLIKTIAGDEVKTPFTGDNEAEMKRFVLTLAEKCGLLDEAVETAARCRNAVSKGAKKIFDRLSLSIDGKSTEEKLESTFENIKDKLTLAARELGDGADAEKIRRSMEDVKENMKFLSELKNNQYLEIPLFLDGRKEHAELYVFSREGGGNRKGNSNSALLSLDLANLGHFETYVQKTGRSVVCQFRPDNEDAEKITREYLEKLATALKDKGYSLDGISFRKTDEKFELTDDEPSIGGDGAAVKNEGSFSFDYRT